MESRSGGWCPGSCGGTVHSGNSFAIAQGGMRLAYKMALEHKKAPENSSVYYIQEKSTVLRVREKDSRPACGSLTN